MASDQTSQTSNDKPKKVITKKDLTLLAIKTNFIHSAFSYERMQAGGWTGAQIACLKKIYGDDKKKLSEAMTENMEFFNTHPIPGAMLIGLLISLEEEHAPRETIRGLKNALFGPLAGIGDAIFMFTVLPIVGGITASLAKQGNITGPIIFFLVYFGLFLLRIPLTRLGYNAGLKSVDLINKYSSTISKSATVLGTTVIGALIASTAKLVLKINIHAGTQTVSIQKDFLDKIFPNILPFAITFLLYWLLRKKVSPTWLIVGIFVFALLFSFMGVI